MPNLSDSDDSDDDFLFQQRIFAKPKSTKQELTPIETLEQIVSAKPIIPDKDGTEQSTGRKRTQARREQLANKKRAKSKKEKSKNKRRKEIALANKLDDPEWIETQARKTVEEILSLDVVHEVTDLNQIGWYCCKKGKTTEYFPVKISQNKAEARMLLTNNNKKKYKTQKIQYIGVVWRYALKYDEIALSKWIPYSESSDSQNEERLRKFVKHISKTSLFKNDPVSLKIEELAIRKMWEKVLVQQEQRQLEEEKERANALQSASNIDPTVCSDLLVNVTQDSDNNIQHNEEKEDTDSDDDDEDDANSLSLEKKQTKRSSLRLNDVIEFYDLIGIFGDPSSLRRATVVGIRPNNSLYPLILSSTTMPIPRSHRVRRLPDGCWQPINNFVLLQEGIQSLADSGSGLNKATNDMRKIEAEIAHARDDFWMNKHVAGEKDKKTEDQDNILQNKEKPNDNSRINDGDVPVHGSRRSSVRILTASK